ncbi:MAG: Ig-like domain-containing protein [bacterium]
MIKRKGIVTFFICLTIGLLICSVGIRNTSAQLPSTGYTSANLWQSQYSIPQVSLAIGSSQCWQGLFPVMDLIWSPTPAPTSWGTPVVPLESKAPKLESLTIQPARFSLTKAGMIKELIVIGYFSDGATQDLTMATSCTTYTSNDTDIAIVDKNGKVTAKKEGQVTIAASNNGITAFATGIISIAGTPGIKPVLKSTTYQMGPCEVIVDKGASKDIVTSNCKVTGPMLTSDLMLCKGEDGDCKTIGWIADDTIIEAHSSPGCYYYFFYGECWQICDY